VKGLEFETVFITGTWDGHWGNRRSRDFFPLLPHKKEVAPEASDSDERRLFYVALTRAKEEVIITYAIVSDDGKPRLVSRFVSEIDERLVQVHTREVTAQTGFIMAPEKSRAVSLREKNYLVELFREEGLNVTALNNYLECPWKYFFVNLLRIPKAMSRPQYYGVAVHSALHRLSEQAALGRPATKEILLSFFSEALRRLPLTEIDHEVLLKKGREALGGYYRHSKEALLAPGFSEFSIKGLSYGETTLSGALDKVIFLSEGGTRVIDYKTRAPLSRNVILGATKTSDGAYYRQLVFYTLLLSLYKKGSLKPKEVEIDFIEPNPAGKYKNELFVVSDQEVEDLGEIIKKVSGEIKNFSFWQKRCNKKDCEFCALRELMEPRATSKKKRKNK
jgi:DNA helicase-2/ATP-dependent DNA helicase PcrA